MLLFLIYSAFAAEPPCYGHLGENRRDSAHYWVEWDGDALSEDEAQILLDNAELSRAAYIERGWPMTEQPVVFFVRREEGGGISGVAQTLSCGELDVPQVNLTVRRFSEQSAIDVTSHELGHVAQYGYMGDYLDSVASWLWWMEGTASWMETLVAANEPEWKSTALQYLDHPHIALHQGPPAWLDEDRTDHMYGTVVIASFLEQRYGGPDIVRQIWQWAGERTGEPLNLLDALDGVGLDGRAVWEHWLATAPVVDLALVPRRGAKRTTDVEVLPASGASGDLVPEGYGFNVVHFAASAGVEGQDLEITFDGASWADWAVVIAATGGEEPGSPLIGHTSVTIEQGRGVGRVPFDGTHDLWLVVSPLERSLETFEYSWQATLVRSVDGEPPPPDIATCATLAPPTAWLWVLLLPYGARRRR